MKKVITRLKNAKVLIAVASGILLILVNLGVIDQALSDQYLEVINIALGIGVTIGILGNPETPLKKPNLLETKDETDQNL